jgi:hypothetical protein
VYEQYILNSLMAKLGFYGRTNNPEVHNN